MRLLDDPHLVVIRLTDGVQGRVSRLLAFIWVLLRVSLWAKLLDLWALRLAGIDFRSAKDKGLHHLSLLAVFVSSCVMVKVIIVIEVLLLVLWNLVYSGRMLSI